MSIRIMMKLIKNTNSNQVYLFDLRSKTENYKVSNPLKEFLYFIKYNGFKGAVNFSYSAGCESIHPNKSIKDNFILDSVPTSLIKNKEDNFRFRLTELKNQNINELITRLEPIEREKNEYNKLELSLASIVKSLLSESEYIFLVNADLEEDYELFLEVKKCIEFEVLTNKRKVFISTSRPERWLDISENIVQKSSDHQFITSKNPLCKSGKKKQEQPLSFSLVDKVS